MNEPAKLELRAPGHGRSRIRTIVDWVLGVTLLMIGIAGFLLPILQGWIFFLAGLAVLGNHSRRIHRLNLVLRSWLKKFSRRLRRSSPVQQEPGPTPVPVPVAPRGLLQ